MLPAPITPQCLKTIPWRNAEIIEAFSRIELVEFALSDPPKVLRKAPASQSTGKTVENVVRSLIGEGLDHFDTISRIPCYNIPSHDQVPVHSHATWCRSGIAVSVNDTDL
jgi:hypothetical protein